MKLLFSRFLLFVSLLCLGGSSANAAITLSTADGNGADTTLSNDGNQSGGVNLGAGTTFNVRRFDGTRMKMGYLRFDLSGVTGDLSDATITLFPTSVNRNRTLNIFGVVDGATGGLGENWDESLINYNNAAGIDQAGGGTNDGTFAFSAEMTASLTTIDTVQNDTNPIVSQTSADMDNYLAADTNGLVTFAFFTTISDSNQSLFFSTKEGAGGAQLFLPNATAVPEPGAALFVGLGSVLMAFRRKRSS